MADLIVGPTVKVLLEKALFLATDRIGLAFGIKKDLESMRESAEMIQAVLADAEAKQTESRAVQLWLKRLKRVALDVDNVLDEFNYEILSQKVKSGNLLPGKVCLFFSSKFNIPSRLTMSSKLRNIKNNLKRINQEATEFGFVRIVAQQLTPTGALTTRRHTDSVVAQNVVGRANDESKIVEVLLTSSDRIVSVLPIIGMGGLGKTTLAKSVYNHQQIDRHFGKKIWVCVSEKFEVMEILKHILESLRGNKVELSNRDAVVQEIRKELEEIRYLLVLDDVWNEIPNLWNDFFGSLLGLSTTSGSCCLLTTRLLTTASIVSTNEPFYLQKLSDDDCWSILAEKATIDREVPELNVLRKPLIKRCNGLPLAANIIGGLLRLQRKEDWHSIVVNNILNFSGDNDNNVMQILKLSFDYLPSPNIKKCFAYCSLFDKDAEMKSNQLIELWMAEGFLQENLENDTMMEEIGGNYFRILLQSSLLEEVKYRSEGRQYYEMHDLVHDLAKLVSKTEGYNVEKSMVEHNCPVQYLAMDSFGERTKDITDETSAFVRTLFLKSSLSHDLLLKFKHLHVLNFCDSKLVKVLPNSIGKLKHLRYLDLSYSGIKLLPESLCKLYNLQTLRITWCTTLRGLPKGMRNLISLRHLYYFNNDAKYQMPVEMGRLTCLQTLKFFNVGEEKGLQIEELGCLNYLKGKLVIRNLELVKGKEGAERANLSVKQNLIELELQWGNLDPEAIQNSVELVLEGLEPHANLRRLKIVNFLGDQFPRWIGNLSMLVKLKFQDCKRCKELPVLGHLPCLEHLELSELQNVSCIGASFYGIQNHKGGRVLGSTSCGDEPQVVLSLSGRSLFPSLRTLKLKFMSKLVEWKAPETIENDALFPVLEDLLIFGCSQLIIAPTHFPNLKRLSIHGNAGDLVVQNILSKVTTTLEYLSLRRLTCSSDLLGLQHKDRFPNLRYLRLESCLNITCVNLHLCSLNRLEIRGCPRILRVGPPPNPTTTNNQERRQQQNQGLNPHSPPLKYFEIRDCDQLSSIAVDILECCTSLNKLMVSKCPNLASFPLDLRQTPSLLRLDLSDCPKLFTNGDAPRGFGHLTNLRTAFIGPFSDADSSMNLFDWLGFISCSSTLCTLSLEGSSDQDALLPDQLQHLTSLTRLSLWNFESLSALPDWLGNLTSLQELYLWRCPNLGCLPSLVAMKRLTMLEKLRVERCPLLQERCRPNSNPDSEWHKIFHLPNLRIESFLNDKLVK